MNIMARCAIYTPFLEIEASFIFYDEVTRATISGELIRVKTLLRSGHTMKAKPHVKLYTKPGCHLCEEARQEMLAAGIEGEYTFEEVNIEQDTEAYERYKFEIPVITVDGHKAFKHRLTAKEFKRRILRPT